MGIWLLCMIVFPLFFLKPGSTAAPIIMTSILVVGLNALYQVIYAMISDCVEVDELLSGERREGLFYSMATNPLTKKRYSEVLEAVRLKRAGKEIALDEFKDLLLIKKK